MAKPASPYQEGPTCSMRRRFDGRDYYVGGQRSPAAARKAMEKEVRENPPAGTPYGLGPQRTFLAQALQDYGRQRLPFMKGARQEANRFNRYLRAAGLATLKVTDWRVDPKRPDAPRAKDAKGRGALFRVELVAPTTERRVPQGLGAHRQALADETAKSDRLLRRLARMKMSAIESYHVQEFLDAMREAGRSASTLQLERAVLRRLFNYARDSWKWPLRDNAAVGMTLPPVNNARSRVLSFDEERQLDEAIADCRNALIAPTVTLLTESAMRSSEPLEHARWRDVDWERCVLKLTDSKTDQRDVPLSPAAMVALRELQTLAPGEPDERIVRISYEALKAAFARACERAGITDLHLHDLRHTAATRMALKTGNIFLVQALTGHKTLSQLQRYVNVKADDVVSVMHATA